MWPEQGDGSQREWSQTDDRPYGTLEFPEGHGGISEGFKERLKWPFQRISLAGVFEKKLKGSKHGSGEKQRQYSRGGEAGLGRVAASGGSGQTLHVF